MGRKTYDKANGRFRPPAQRSDWEWLVQLLREQHRRSRYTTQTPGESRPRMEENQQ